MPDRDWPPSQESLLPLVRALARATARACYELKIEPDMDDPVVAREMLALTFDATFLSRPGEVQRRNRKANAPAGT